jgi:anti-sigma B factor antagonist
MINLYINERTVEDVTILDLKGRERIRGITIALHESIRCLAREGKIQVLLDLAWVKHIDSGALGELVSSHITLDEKGGALKLMHMTESVRELLTITKLLPVFDVYDDEPKALASFVGETLRIVEHQKTDKSNSVMVTRILDQHSDGNNRKVLRRNGSG